MVGAGWVLEKIKGQPIYASDANFALIEMWKALQGGWIPPSVVTEEMHRDAKSGKYEPHLEAFIRFGCGFGGDWEGGYARHEKGKEDPSKYAGQSKRSLLQKINRIRAIFYHWDFFITCPPCPNMLIYTDPPYEDTTAYGAVPPFDSTLFWQRIRYLEGQGHTCVISEYQAPPDFSCVLEMVTKTDMHTKNGKERRVERLFRLGEHQILQPKLF